jgi:hypothetical protein
LEIQNILGFIAGLSSLSAYIPYWYSIFYGNPPTQPQRASWFIWIFSDSLVFATSYSLGATDSLWVPGVYVAGTIITFIMSIKKGTGGTHWFDIVCFLATLISVGLWCVTGDALQSLMINLAIVVVGAGPTILKVIENPYSENGTSYCLWVSGSLLSLISVLIVGEPQFKLWIQPTVFLVLQCVILLMMIRRRIAISHLK